MNINDIGIYHGKYSGEMIDAMLDKVDDMLAADDAGLNNGVINGKAIKFVQLSDVVDSKKQIDASTPYNLGMVADDGCQVYSQYVYCKSVGWHEDGGGTLYRIDRLDNRNHTNFAESNITYIVTKINEITQRGTVTYNCCWPFNKPDGSSSWIADDEKFKVVSYADGKDVTNPNTVNELRDMCWSAFGDNNWDRVNVTSDGTIMDIKAAGQKLTITDNELNTYTIKSQSKSNVPEAPTINQEITEDGVEVTFRSSVGDVYWIYDMDEMDIQSNPITKDNGRKDFSYVFKATEDPRTVFVKAAVYDEYNDTWSGESLKIVSIEGTRKDEKQKLLKPSVIISGNEFDDERTLTISRPNGYDSKYYIWYSTEAGIEGSWSRAISDVICTISNSTKPGDIQLQWKCEGYEDSDIWMSPQILVKAKKMYAAILKEGETAPTTQSEIESLPTQYSQMSLPHTVRLKDMQGYIEGDNYGRLLFAYSASNGVVDSIKDGSGLDCTYDFVQSEISGYYLYTMKYEAELSGARFTFQN